MASKNSNSNWIKYLSLFNLLAVLILALAIFHIVKIIGNIAVSSASVVVNQNKITSVSYKCDGGKTIFSTYFNGKVELSLSDGRSLLLMQGMSGSGVRYTNSDESVTFWNKGDTAFLEQGSTTTYTNCNQAENL